MVWIGFIILLFFILLVAGETFIDHRLSLFMDNDNSPAMEAKKEASQSS